MNKDILFNEFTLDNSLHLKNRILMAPMSRSMSNDDLVPTSEMAEYYARRADAGLIIVEATNISLMAQGYPNTAGLYNQEQVKAWKIITDKVHENGGKIFVQIWHCGRVSHPFYLKGQLPMAPSAVALKGRVPRGNGFEYGIPKAMSEEEIFHVIQEFAQAAAHAKKAGFDGVELHGANGYLLDQFLHFETNKRTDDWGGTPEKMVRFLLEVIKAVKQEIKHVGLRLSPVGHLNMALNEDDKIISDGLLHTLNEYDLAYIHTGSLDDTPYDHIKGTVTQYIRRLYKGTVIACGSYTPETAREILRQGDADLVAIGRPLIANPDYVEKVRNGHALTPYNAEMLNELV